MGRYLSADFGFGLILPTGDEDDFTAPDEFKDWFKPFIEEQNDDPDYGYVTYDWYEIFEALKKEFPVHISYSYVEDYSAGNVVLTKSTKQDVDYIDAVEVGHLPTFEEMDALGQIAKRFGIEFDPRWLIAVSYG